MPLPSPEPGLVICYDYLWRREARRGATEGRKSRPAAILLAVEKQAGSQPDVVVAAITHSPPSDPATAIELPPRVKQAIGLDDARSWVVLDEVNRFTWPGFDVRPVAGSAHGGYGFLPPRFLDALIARLLQLAAERRLAQIPRD